MLQKQPNATLQARLEAEAERTLEAVACKRLLGENPANKV
jgi:hypothetical protein